MELFVNLPNKKILTAGKVLIASILLILGSIFFRISSALSIFSDWFYGNLRLA
jgi:hypothetical protein